MAGQHKLPDGDDGRTIASMDIDGMPWHGRDRTRPPFRDDSGESSSKEKLSFPAVGGILTAIVVVVLAFAGVFAALLVLLGRMV